MANYTMTLDEVLELGYKPFDTISDVITDVALAEKLKNAVTEHYRFYEIGFETPGRFVHETQVRISELATYNQKFEAYKVEIKPLATYENISDSVNAQAEYPENYVINVDPTFEHPTSAGKTTTTTSGYNGQQIDLINNYVNKYKDLENEYIDEFSDLFMLIY